MVLYREQINGTKFSQWYQAAIEDFKTYFKYKPKNIIRVQVFLVKSEIAYAWNCWLGWSAPIKNDFFHPFNIDEFFERSETYPTSQELSFQRYLRKKFNFT